ncbi:DnaJ-like protein [Luteibacter rhizovicinus]|uniref:DnaJ-like protein n=1 Tax=Luteibacter rhizovicinus TaxID=242606 RepID=A0A4R3YWU4_9GAMM|nr:DnaJ domain-containing protein [Luteibacter rhizovicinus]TCV97625.1 DnaJ-like protein [Luteibacter rhizovicinus]
MSSETDFLDLYQKLGVSPGCDVAEFKQAYRRHIAQLHPDRAGNASVDAGELQRVIAQYGAAMDFLRRHGRLPGAAPSRGGAANEPVVPQRVSEPRTAPPRFRARLVLIGIVLVVGIVLWQLDPLAPAGDSGTGTAPEDVESKPASHTNVSTIALGMSQDEVRAIEGEPMIMHDDQWDYGPSWIRFEHGKVVDWYSSPMHTLSTPSARPSR